MGVKQRTSLTNEEMALPVWAKYALMEMRRRWHRIEVCEVEADHEPPRIFVRVWANEDTLDPTYRYVWQQKGVTWHQDYRNGRLGPQLPVRELNRATTTTSQESRHVRRRRSRPSVDSTVTELKRPDTVQGLLTRRSELVRQMHTVELEFMKTLDWGEHAMLVGYREILDQLEIDIIVAKEEAEETAAERK